MSGFETGHPAAAGSLPAFDFSVSDEQDAAFFVSVMDYSDCDSSGLDSPNSSWSMARLKEYLRRKKRPSKREKKPSFFNVIISTDIVTSNPSLFFLFFFFFSLYLLLLVMHHTSHLQERSPTSIALLFLQSCLNAHCVLAYIACWPLERRILHELYFACAATFRAPPVFDRAVVSSFGQWESTARFLSGLCLSLLRSPRSFHWRPAHGDFKLRAQKKKINK